MTTECECPSPSQVSSTSRLCFLVALVAAAMLVFTACDDNGADDEGADEAEATEEEAQDEQEADDQQAPTEDGDENDSELSYDELCESVCAQMARCDLEEEEDCHDFCAQYSDISDECQAAAKDLLHCMNDIDDCEALEQADEPDGDECTTEGEAMTEFCV